MSNWRDPGLRAAAVLVGLVLLGFVILGIAWHSVASTIIVPYQLPVVVSGGFAGVALIGFAAVSLELHLARRSRAIEREEWEQFVRSGAELAEKMRNGRPE